MTINNSKRKAIKAGSQLIHQTIYNQAGSIEKALLEYIMNSIDAKATRIDIVIKDDGINYSILDNGDGFGDSSYSREEKEKCIDEVFGYLGFDHGSDDDNYRVYGKFGIGRAQLWAFSKNTWHTHDMMMDVDVLHEGLNYEIKQVDEHINGCKITGKFYDRILPNNILLIKKELSKFSAYAPIEVYFNGKKINKELSSLKDSLKIDGITVQTKESSSLVVYNQGVFVREYPNYVFGVGGIACSHVGHPFELNAARNDVLQSKCPLWKNLKKALDKRINTEIKKTKLTDETRKNLLSRIAVGDYGENDVYLTKPLLKMINNRYISIKAVIESPFTISENRDDSKAETIQRESARKVLLSDFTSSLSLTNDDFVQELEEIRSNKFIYCTPLKYEDIMVLKSKISNTNFIIPDKELTKRQKIFLKTINMTSIQNLLSTSEEVDHPYYDFKISRNMPRKIFIGKSKTSNAWTDGVTYIAINEELVKGIDNGAGHILRILNTIVHEYNHDDDNGDLHSLDFYKNTHDQLIYDSNSIFGALINFIRSYTTNLVKNDFVVNKKLNRSLNLLYSFSEELDNEPVEEIEEFILEKKVANG